MKKKQYFFQSRPIFFTYMLTLRALMEKQKLQMEMEQKIYFTEFLLQTNIQSNLIWKFYWKKLLIIPFVQNVEWFENELINTECQTLQQYKLTTNDIVMTEKDAFRFEERFCEPLFLMGLGTEKMNRVRIHSYLKAKYRGAALAA